jgi:putative DNA primase/helicase
MLDALRELQELDQWVCWRLPEKMPLNPRNGHNAQANNPKTWACYIMAKEAVKTYGLDGVGFVFSKNDPYVGIDFDNCFEDGEVIPEVLRWIKYFNSYAEVSPSGKGIHIIIRGKLPGRNVTSRKIIDRVEMYDHDHFFTITGVRYEY